MENNNVVTLNGNPIDTNEGARDISKETVDQVFERMKDMLPDAEKVFMVVRNADDENIYTYSNYENIQELYWYLSIIMHETLAQ